MTLKSFVFPKSRSCFFHTALDFPEHCFPCTFPLHCSGFSRALSLPKGVLVFLPQHCSGFSRALFPSSIPHTDLDFPEHCAPFLRIGLARLDQRSISKFFSTFLGQIRVFLRVGFTLDIPHIRVFLSVHFTPPCSRPE